MRVPAVDHLAVNYRVTVNSNLCNRYWPECPRIYRKRHTDGAYVNSWVIQCKCYGKIRTDILVLIWWNETRHNIWINHSINQNPIKCYFIVVSSSPAHAFTGKRRHSINTLRPRQNGRHFADVTFKRIFLNENVRILIKISLKFVPKGPINNIPALVQIMAWRRPGDKPLSEPMMDNLPTHICVTRPQWVKTDLKLNH